MREILKNKRIVIISILAIVVIIILVLNQTNIIETITNRIRNVMLAQGESAETNAYYEIVSKNEDDLEILITIENPNGIEKIVSGDTEYQCKGKQTVALDRKMKEGEEQEYKITPVDGKEELYTILASSKPNLKLIKYEKREDKIYATIDATCDENDSVINSYSIDEGEKWNVYDNTFEIDLDNNKEEELEKNIIIKREYKNGKTISKVPLSSITVSNNMGLLYNVENINQEEYYQLKERDETYNIHAYVLSENTVIDEDTVYGDENDIGNNMVVVKVNGDLTINEGKTVTAVRKYKWWAKRNANLLYRNINK